MRLDDGLCSVARTCINNLGTTVPRPHHVSDSKDILNVPRQSQVGLRPGPLLQNGISDCSSLAIVANVALSFDLFQDIDRCKEVEKKGGAPGASERLKHTSSGLWAIPCKEWWDAQCIWYYCYMLGLQQGRRLNTDHKSFDLYQRLAWPKVKYLLHPGSASGHEYLGSFVQGFFCVMNWRWKHFVPDEEGGPPAGAFRTGNIEHGQTVLIFPDLMPFLYQHALGLCNSLFSSCTVLTLNNYLP